MSRANDGRGAGTSYGIDAPYVLILLTVMGVGLVGLGALNAAAQGALAAAPSLVSGMFLVLSAGSYLYTTRRGKFVVWSALLEQLELGGSETILDMGCGRGAVLISAAERVPEGLAVGVDLWRWMDQSGNSVDVTSRNAVLKGVANRVELCTADITALPFADCSFDLVVSSLAIHNIPRPERRRHAVQEGVRVLKPGGRLLIADIRKTDEYFELVRNLGAVGVIHRGLGWRAWFGGPWMAARVVSATKQPSSTRQSVN